MTDLSKELDKIIDMSFMGYALSKETRKKIEAQILALIAEREREARIDELKRFMGKDNGEVEVTYQRFEDRIKNLKGKSL